MTLGDTHFVEWMPGTDLPAAILDGICSKVQRSLSVVKSANYESQHTPPHSLPKYTVIM